jgi:hypothetical protein
MVLWTTVCFEIHWPNNLKLTKGLATAQPKWQIRVYWIISSARAKLRRGGIYEA